MICISGTPTIMPKVTRSRESWRTSLVATALSRRTAALILSAAKFFGPRRDDEHVFQAGVGELDARVDPMLLQQRAQLRLGVFHVSIGEHAQPDTELGHAMHPRKLADEARRFAAIRAFDFEDVGLDSRHQCARRAFGDHAAFGDDREAVAALGL